VDNESNSDSDFDSDGSGEDEKSSDRDEEQPGSDLEITVNWGTKPASPPSRHLPMEVHRAVPSPTPQPSRRVNVGRIQELLRKKDEATLAKLATPSNTHLNQAITAVNYNTNSGQAQPKLHGAQGSNMGTSHVPRSLTSLARQSTSDQSAISRSKMQSAESTARSGIQSNSAKVNKELSRSTDVKSALNTWNSVKPVQSAPRSSRDGGPSTVIPGSALYLSKRPASIESRLTVSSDTASTRHGTQDAGSAITPQIGTAAAGNSKSVDNVLQGVRQSGQLQKAAILHKSPPTSAQAKGHGHISQMPGSPRTVATNLSNQTLQRIQSRKTSEAARKQTKLPQHNPAAPNEGVTGTLSSTSRPAAAQNPSPQTVSRTHTPQIKLARTSATKLQVPSSVTSVQKRKAEDVVRRDVPSAKKLTTALTNPKSVIRLSTEALDTPNPTISSSTTKSIASLKPTGVEKKAAASRSTLTTKQQPRAPLPRNTVQEANPTPLTTTRKQPNLQEQAPRNVPKEVIQNPNLAQVIKGSSANLLQSTRTDKIAMQKPPVRADHSVKGLSTVIQEPKDARPNGTMVSQVKDAVPRLSIEMQKGQGESIKESDGVVSTPIANGPPSIPVRLPKTHQKIPGGPLPPTSQMIKKGLDPAGNSLTSLVKLQPPHTTAPQHRSTPITIPSTSPTLAPDAEPYFEYSIFQKIWSDSEEESSVTARELASHPCTNIDEANDQAERLFNDALHQYKQHFQVQFIEWTNRLDAHGCNALTGTFAPYNYPSKKSRMKLWVQRDQVSVHAGRREKDLKCTSFVAKTLYVLRLFKLISPTSDSDTDDTAQITNPTRVYYPLPCTECYTTLDAANRAARNLQIELSHKSNPSDLDKLWQIQNLEQLNRKARELVEAEAEDGRYWKSEFNGSGLGSATFELLVERVGLCGPRNL
jgi:hypothetical protein